MASRDRPSSKIAERAGDTKPRGSAEQRRVIVCGSRGYEDRNAIANRLADIPPPYDGLVIVHGNARGVDRIAHQEAEKLGYRVEAHPADWERYGKGAGPIRNQEMADAGAELVIAFWDGKSTGTLDMIGRAYTERIPVEVNAAGRPLTEVVDISDAIRKWAQ